jgi:hypothetical protein
MLQLIETVLLCSAVDDGISKEFSVYPGMKHGSHAGSSATGFVNVLGILEFPSVTAFVVN